MSEITSSQLQQLLETNFVSVPEECQEKCKKLEKHIAELALMTHGDALNDPKDTPTRAVVCDRYSWFRGCGAMCLSAYDYDTSRVLSTRTYTGRKMFDLNYSTVEESVLMDIASEANGRVSLAAIQKLTEG